MEATGNSVVDLDRVTPSPMPATSPAPSESGTNGRVVSEAGICTGLPRMLIPGSRQLVEQRLRLFEVGGVEAFGEPAVDGCQKVAGLGETALLAAESGEARGGAQFPELGLLLLSDVQGLAIELLGGLGMPLQPRGGIVQIDEHAAVAERPDAARHTHPHAGLVAGRNWRNLPMVAPVTVLGIANLLMHLEADGVTVPRRLGWRLGLAAVIVLISVVAGRIVPNSVPAARDGNRLFLCVPADVPLLLA
jgi:hypothetical protein